MNMTMNPLFYKNPALKWACMAALILLTGFTPACKKGLFNPAETDTIRLTAQPDRIKAGESCIITVSGTLANGKPMPDQTLVHVTADSGKFLDAARKEVQAVLLYGGKGELTYQSDSAFTGAAVNIKADSGAAKVIPEQLTITITSIDITQLFIVATPSSLPPGGGDTEVVISGLNASMQPVEGKSIFFTASAGNFIPPPPLTTNVNGEIKSTLSTAVATTISATYKEVVKTLDVTVGLNVPPVALFTFSPAAPVSGQTVYFTSTSTDPDGQITAHRWTFGDGGSSSQKNPSRTYTVTAETVFIVTLTVTDNNKATASITQSVKVIPPGKKPPIAAFTWSPQTPKVGDTVFFISQSTDEDGAITAYKWNFGDGKEATEKNPSHKYSATATTVYNVQLTVTDNDGLSGAIVIPVTVTQSQNQPPSAIFAFSPAAPKGGQSVSFNGSASNDPDGSITAYTWDFGDGHVGSGSIVAHTYSITADTAFIVTLTVTDNLGAKNSVSQQIPVTAVNQPPIARFTFSPTAPTTATPVNFDASSSSDPDGTIAAYTWDFGDGSTGAGAGVSHIFTTAATYVVTLTVTDNKGASNTVNRNVTIATPRKPGKK